MKRKTFLFICLLFTMLVSAGNVTTEQAEQIATQFLNKHLRTGARWDMKIAQKQSLSLNDAADVTAYYVFNVGNNEGFVMVSGSDLAPQVLAYADHGKFEKESIPANMQAWLQSYSDQISYLEQTGGKNEAPRQTIQRNAVSPLLTSTWGQESPYWNMCPVDPTTNQLCYTGCVATALAQVINYHKYPSQTIAAIPAYTTETRSISMPEIGVTTIDWDNMLDTYNGYETTENKNAVAQLMLLCGQAVAMDYTSAASGSSTQACAKALKSYFGFDASVRALERYAFSTTTWEQIIYDELAASRPVLYGGSSLGGGHEFVIDGYSTDGLFHVNWGWNGSCDGYFLLSVLNPYNNSGAGASSTKDGYSIEQDAVIGIKHGTDEVISERFSVVSISNTGDATVTRSSSENDFTGISIQLKGYNMTGDTHHFALNLALVNSVDEVITTIASNVEADKDNFYGWGALTFSNCTFGTGLSDGDYYIVPVSKTENSEDWELCWGANVYRIKASIVGNTLTLTNPTVNLSATIQATGNAKVLEKVPLTAQVTNNGSYFNGYVYLAVNGYLDSGRILEAQAGETVNFDIDFVPSSAGNKTLLLAYKGDNGYVIFGSGEVNVASDLDCVVNVTNATNGIVGEDKVTATVDITNNASDYDDYILLRLFKYDSSSSNYTYVDIQSQHLTLASGETTTLDFEFSGLENTQQYLLSLMYYKAGNTVQDASATFTTQMLQDGDLFTARTEENVSMTFKVISAADKTCQVGAGESTGVVTIGESTSNSTNMAPYDNYYKYSTVQMLYTPDEIGQKGKITKIAYKVASSTSCPTTSVKIYMGHKSGIFSSTSDYVTSSNLTLVYSGSPTLGSSTGWETLTLNQNSFTYNGTDNLVIVITKSCSNYKSGLKYSCFTGSGYMLYRNSDSDTSYGNITNTSTSYSTATTRPSVKFTIETLPVAIPTTTRGIITIPSTVNNYKVVSIGEKAFNNCTSVSGVKIPGTITDLQTNAFYGCTGLIGITSKIRFPFAVVSSVFNSIPTNATLYVPYGSKERYESTNGWNGFESIVEMEPEDGDVFTAKTDEDVDMTFKIVSTSDMTCRVTTGNESVSAFVPTIPSATPDYITIPDEVNGFTITGIDSHAFIGCNALTSVSIPGNVSSIGDAVFEGCDNLVSVYIDVVTPVAISESVFPNRANATLYVPASSKSSYETADYWKEFKIIKEMPDKVNNAIDLADAIGCRGGLVVQPIILKNNESIVGFQFDLLVSEGVTVAQDADGKYMATLTERKADHLLSVNKVGERLYRFVSISMNNAEFNGTDGTILNVKLKIDESVVVGTYEVKVQNTELINVVKDNIYSVKNMAALTVQDAEPGDVNGDFSVSVTDVTGIIGYILNDPPAIFIEYAAHMNDDKKISVTDAVIVIDKILHDGVNTQNRAPKQMGPEPQ